MFTIKSPCCCSLKLGLQLISTYLIVTFTFAYILNLVIIFYPGGGDINVTNIMSLLISFSGFLLGMILVIGVSTKHIGKCRIAYYFILVEIAVDVMYSLMWILAQVINGEIYEIYEQKWRQLTAALKDCVYAYFLWVINAFIRELKTQKNIEEGNFEV